MRTNDLRCGGDPKDFIWASGIENTFVPQTRPGHRALDEYALMEHYKYWRNDLGLLKELRVQAVRWGVPWYRVEPIAGEFDWRWTDEVIPYLVEELKVFPIIDLMHYGCPFWLRREFASDEYPKAIARYAAAFATRYKRLVKWYTPLNEPLVTALFCGKKGLWPPYLRSDRGYVLVLLQLVKGILRTVEAIKSADPNAVFVHVDASGLSRAAREDLEALAVEEQRRGFLVYDLLTGNLTPDHPLFPWLVRQGASPDELASIRRSRIALDIIGLNFYPQWSTTQLYINRRGKLAYRSVERDGSGFTGLIRDFYHRYQTPIIVTETSARGNVKLRARWLKASVSAIKQLRSEGIPIQGYTWFPLFTMIDWRYRFGRRPPKDYRLDLGLYKLAKTDHKQRWQPTVLVEQFKNYVLDPVESIGPLAAA